MIKRLMLAALLAASGTSSLRAESKCSVKTGVILPVTMVGLRPTVQAKIEGQDVTLEADSGAYFSMISPGSAAELNLHKEALPAWYQVTGMGGSIQPYVAKAKTFTIGGVTLSKVDFLVGGSEFGSVGLLGQNVLATWDTEFDLAHSVIRLMRSEGCAKSLLAYWARPDEAFSMLQTDDYSPERPHIIAPILVNGVRMRALFDTGAATSFLSLKAAAKVGLKPDAPGVVAAGASGGIGRGMVSTWVGPVASVTLGAEEIRNTRLRFGGEMGEFDMLLGADFFLSHHVYWAKSLRRIFFTFNGGHVFDLQYLRPDAVADVAPPPAAVAARGADEGAPPKAAADYFNRGQVRSARGDFRGAADDLDRAVAMDAANVEYLRRRALLRLRLNNPEKALEDLNALLKLKGNDSEALMMRAGLRRAKDRSADVRADVDAAAAGATKSSDLRLAIGGMYDELEFYPQAIAQYDLWIAAHPDDNKRPMALNGRCWARTLSGQQLEQALKDCNQALSLRPHTAAFLDSRGLVRLRLGDYARAVADYDEALKLQPKMAWSLYGRGIARLRLGQKAPGDADIAKAKEVDSTIAERARKLGIVP